MDKPYLRFIVLMVLALAGYSGLSLATTFAGSHCGETVRVAPGDTLARIAARCGISVSGLLAANPEIRNPNIIHLGQIIRIPGRAVGRTAPAPGPSGRCGTVVTVRPGDTLARIAFRCGTSVGRLLAANPQIRDPSRLFLGMRIRIPSGGIGRPGPIIVLPPRPREPAEVQLTGTITAEGVTCPAMRGDDGRLYTLAGEIGQLRPGTRVHVMGFRTRTSICQQGITIDVERLRRIGFEDDFEDDDEGEIEVSGTITSEGVTCLAMRGDDGRLYTLSGDTGGFGPGDRVRVEGARAEVSICQQGITIDVIRVRPAWRY